MSRSRSQSPSPQASKKQRREATVYDAVAGRVASDGFLPDKTRFSRNRDIPSSSTVAVAPEEVLFRRDRAPVRYEDNDFYWASRNLTEKQTLPESDLLKAIHTYASDFYGRATKSRGVVDFQSLDETALLGLGLLMEEMAEHVLGSTGDLAFGEGEEIEKEAGDPSIREKHIGSDEGDKEDIAAATTKVALPKTASSSGKRRKRKRRKVHHNVNDEG